MAKTTENEKYGSWISKDDKNWSLRLFEACKGMHQGCRQSLSFKSPWLQNDSHWLLRVSFTKLLPGGMLMWNLNKADNICWRYGWHWYTVPKTLRFHFDACLCSVVLRHAVHWSLQSSGQWSQLGNGSVVKLRGGRPKMVVRTEAHNSPNRCWVPLLNEKLKRSKKNTLTRRLLSVVSMASTVPDSASGMPGRLVSDSVTIASATVLDFFESSRSELTCEIRNTDLECVVDCLVRPSGSFRRVQNLKSQNSQNANWNHPGQAHAHCTVCFEQNRPCHGHSVICW